MTDRDATNALLAAISEHEQSVGWDARDHDTHLYARVEQIAAERLAESLT